MNLHETPKLFKDSVRATAGQMSMLDIYVEKDYWVTKALHVIFSNKIGQEVVFKGGTALSKCYGLIERFSEDIDLVVLKRAGESGNQIKNKLKAISTVVNDLMPEVNIEGITNKLGMIRKTAHEYPKIFAGEYGQVRDKVILESSSLGNHEPYHEQNISSYIHEMMLNTGLEEMIQKYQLEPFTVQVLDIKRTLCEKILSLVRFSHSKNPIDELKMKIRHLYDLHQLLQEKEVLAFFESTDFEEMLNRVGDDDVEGYRNNNHWLKHHPREALIFAKPVEVWNELETTYSHEFKVLVYGFFPATSDILTTLKTISERVSIISWNVNDKASTQIGAS